MTQGTEFGENVRRLRESIGWSRAEVLRRLESVGVAMYPTTIKRIEDGEQVAKVHEAVGLARIFASTVEELEASAPGDLDAALLNAARGVGSAADAAMLSLKELNRQERELNRLVALAEEQGGKSRVPARVRLHMSALKRDRGDLARLSRGRDIDA